MKLFLLGMFVGGLLVYIVLATLINRYFRRRGEL